MRSKVQKFYVIYQGMHRRCYDETYHSFHRYGGRGIKVWEGWHDYQQFKKDLMDQWCEGMSLDRLDNDGDYSPFNCELVPKELNNKPRKIDYKELMELREQGVPYKELADYYGVSLSAVNAAAYKVRNGKAFQ